MSLESKSKTAYQIKKEIECPTPESASCIGCTFDCETKEKKQYIPLEVAQKLQDLALESTDDWSQAEVKIEQLKKQVDFYKEAGAKLLAYNLVANTKIIEANKTLDNLLSHAQTMNYYIQNKDIRYTQRTQKWLSEYDLQELKKVLVEKSPSFTS